MSSMSSHGSNDLSSDEFVPPRRPLQNFCVRWDRPSQRFGARKQFWSSILRPIPWEARALLNWQQPSRQVQDVSLGDKFTDIFFAKLDVGFDEEWFFEQALGRGGFGAVALFICNDTATQKLIDKVVVKTAKSSSVLAVDPTRLDLSIEAALMGQTNDLERDGMLALRQFKHYTLESQWKYYLEYCPYGDLERLRIRYKAYGRYLPEFFLWHLFYWLAKTIHEYSSYNQWLDTDLHAWGSPVRDGFLLHSDIKTQNIFLGPPDPDQSDDASFYPIPRMADLGLALVETEHHQDNWAAGLYRGTVPWHPPEMRYYRMHTQTNFYPFGSQLGSNMNDQYRKGRHKITSRANLWAIGAVMYSMMSLNEIHKLSTTVDQVLQEAQPLPRHGQGDVLVDNSHFGIIAPQYYSIELRDLINECLHIVPEDRPSEEELLDRTQRGYQSWLNVAQSQTPFGTTVQQRVDTNPQYKVYYRENEIHNAPDNYRFHHPNLDGVWWTHYFIRDLIWLPPAWGLLWPAWMPNGIQPPASWPKAVRRAFLETAQHVRTQRNASNRGAGNVLYDASGRPVPDLLVLAGHYDQQIQLMQQTVQQTQQVAAQMQRARRAQRVQLPPPHQHQHQPQHHQQPRGRPAPGPPGASGGSGVILVHETDPDTNNDDNDDNNTPVPLETKPTTPAVTRPNPDSFQPYFMPGTMP